MKKINNFTIKTAHFRALAVFSALAALLAFAGCNKEVDDDFAAGTYQYKLEKPTACPIAGEVAPGTEIRLHNAMDPDATIYYTIDRVEHVGGDPVTNTSDRIEYVDDERPVIDGENGDVIIIKAYSVKEGMEDSDVAEFAYTVNDNMAATPTANPDSGEVAPGTLISLSTTTDGAAIYYTTDGSTPTTGSTLYSDGAKPAITVSPTAIKAIAVKDGMGKSATAEFVYTVPETFDNMAATPTASLAEGEVASGAQVTLSTITEGASIYYTTDGSDPATSSTRKLYTGPITINASTTLKAISVKPGMEPSAVQEFVYTVPESFDATIDLAVNSRPVGAGVNYSGNCYTITEDGSYKVIHSTFSNRISVDPNLSVTLLLQDASIELSADENPLDLGDESQVTIKLAGANKLSTTGATKAALHVSETAALTLNSAAGDNSLDGSLFAYVWDRTDAHYSNYSGLNGGAAIGGNKYEQPGPITILGGSITAYSNTDSGAAIGGGGGGGAGSTHLTISGGEVIAVSNSYGAAIGGTQAYYEGGASGDITINGGIVIAHSRCWGPAIGAGTNEPEGGPYNGGELGTIQISGGIVAAFVDDSNQSTSDMWGPAIGSKKTNSGSVSISGGTVIARKGANAKSIAVKADSITVSSAGILLASDTSGSLSDTGVTLLADSSQIAITPPVWNPATFSFDDSGLVSIYTGNNAPGAQVPPGWTLNTNVEQPAPAGAWVIGGTAPAVIDFTKFGDFSRADEQMDYSNYKCNFDDGFYLYFYKSSRDVYIYLKSDDGSINNQMAWNDGFIYKMYWSEDFSESGYSWSKSSHQLTLPSVTITDLLVEGTTNQAAFNEMMEVFSSTP